VHFVQLASTLSTSTYPIQFGGAPIFFASSPSGITPPNMCGPAFHIVYGMAPPDQPSVVQPMSSV